MLCFSGRLRGGSVRENSWHAYKADPLSTERGRKAHLDSVKLTVPARDIQAQGHEVRLIAPIYVKPFVKRQKNDMADAEAITEAAARPTMRFVAVKSAEKQASGMVFKTRDLLVRQRTQTINALRGHLTEHGIIAPQGVFHIGRLAAEVENVNSHLPVIVTELCTLLLRHRPPSPPHTSAVTTEKEEA